MIPTALNQHGESNTVMNIIMLLKNTPHRYRVEQISCIYLVHRLDLTSSYRKIKSDADRQQLQDDLNKLTEWSEKWQMLFNYGKCKCLHTGHGNEDAQYTMGGTVLNTTLKEKDLGLTISANMKVSEQYGIAATKGNQILGLIKRNIVYKEKEPIITLYKTIVRLI